jgi:hypothetical protein
LAYSCGDEIVSDSVTNRNEGIGSSRERTLSHDHRLRLRSPKIPVQEVPVIRVNDSSIATRCPCRNTTNDTSLSSVSVDDIRSLVTNQRREGPQGTDITPRFHRPPQSVNPDRIQILSLCQQQVCFIWSAPSRRQLLIKATDVGFAQEVGNEHCGTSNVHARNDMKHPNTAHGQSLAGVAGR